MISIRVGVQFIFLGVALGVPLASTGQTAVVAPPVARPQSSPPPASSFNSASGLEGRLFYSAQERQRIEAARRRGFVFGDSSQLVDAPPSVLNGFVKRSDGNTAVWVDGNVRWNAQTQNAQNLVPSNVGGPAVYLKSTSGETQAASPKPSVNAKKAVKARVRKNTVPRLLPQ